MPDWIGQFLAVALKALQGHQEAVLALVMVVIAAALEKLTENPYFAFGLPVTIYVLYVLRMTHEARHAERLAEIDVQKIEARGKASRNRARRALERRKP